MCVAGQAKELNMARIRRKILRADADVIAAFNEGAERTHHYLNPYYGLRKGEIHDLALAAAWGAGKDWARALNNRSLRSGR